MTFNFLLNPHCGHFIFTAPLFNLADFQKQQYSERDAGYKDKHRSDFKKATDQPAFDHHLNTLYDHSTAALSLQVQSLPFVAYQLEQPQRDVIVLPVMAETALRAILILSVLFDLFRQVHRSALLAHDHLYGRFDNVFSHPAHLPLCQRRAFQ